MNNNERSILPGAERLAELSRARKEVHWCRFIVCKCGKWCYHFKRILNHHNFPVWVSCKISGVFWRKRWKMQLRQWKPNDLRHEKSKGLVHMSKCKDFNITWLFPQIMQTRRFSRWFGCSGGWSRSTATCIGATAASTTCSFQSSRDFKDMDQSGANCQWIFMNFYFWSYSKVFSTSSQNIPNWLKLPILLPQALTSTSNLRHHQLGLPDAKGTTASSAKPSVAIPHLGGAVIKRGVVRTWDFKNHRKEGWCCFLDGVSVLGQAAKRCWEKASK